MEIIKKIEVRSNEAKYILNMKVKSGGSFVEATLTQMGKIYRLTANQYLFPCISMIRIYGEMSKVKDAMQKHIKDFEKVLHGSTNNLEKINTPVQAVYELRVGNPIIGEMVSLLEMYDYLSTLLWLANNLNLFKKDRHKYFRAVSNNKKRILSIFKITLSLVRNDDKMKLVTISQYLNKDEAFLKVADLLGEIKPALLYSALNIEAFPRFKAEERNIMIQKLKLMS